MRSGLVLHPRPDPVARQHERDLVEPAPLRHVGPEDLELPPHSRCEPLVHLEQVAGEQIRLLATLGTADLDDDVAVVVRVLRQQQQLELGLEPLDVRGGGVGFGASEVAIVAGRVGQHLLRQLEVVGAGAKLAGARDDRVELLVTLRERGVLGLIGEHVGVSKARLDVGELPLETGEALQHG